MVSKIRLPLLAVFVAAFGLLGGAMAQAEEGGPGGGSGDQVPADPNPVLCTLMGGGEACSEEPSEPSEPAPGEPSEPAPGEPSEPVLGEPSEPAPGEPSEPGYPGGGEPS